MTDREKLVELIKKGHGEYYNPLNIGKVYEVIADHLLAHGVTVREPGRWIDKGYKIACSECARSVFLGTTDPVIHRAEKENFKFCPNCGAMMEV